MGAGAGGGQGGAQGRPPTGSLSNLPARVRNPAAFGQPILDPGALLDGGNGPGGGGGFMAPGQGTFGGGIGNVERSPQPGIPRLGPGQQPGKGGSSGSPVESPLEQRARDTTTGLGNLSGTEQQGLNFAGGLGQLSGAEQTGLGFAGQQGGGGFNQAEQAALQQIQRFSGGEIGQSPATQAALASLRPGIQNDLALAGLGNSAEVGSALSAASAPILAEEIRQRSGAIGELTGLGRTVRGGQQFASQAFQRAGEAQRAGNAQAASLFQRAGEAQRAGRIEEANQLNQQAQTLSQRESRLLGEAGEEEERQRTFAAQQQEANFQDFLRRQGLAQNLTTGLLGGLPNITGSRTVSSSSGGGK